MNQKTHVACNFNSLFENEGLLKVRCDFCPLDAIMYACMVFALIACPSVHLSLCVSVTSQSCTKTATCRITQKMLHDSMIVVC